MHDFLQQFATGMRNTSLLEYIAVFTGIASVWYSKKENILVYPVGLVNTIIYIYLSLKGNLIGEASVNLYYTIISIYGWILWAKKDVQHNKILQITFSNKREWIYQSIFFLSFYIGLFFALSFLKKYFEGAIPWADAFASASAYTGMWLMARKKVESWIWWIVTDMASVPLYFIKGFVFTSVYYFILLILAVSGLLEWRRRVRDVHLTT
ncbi:MAG: nicotinamide riboside transporter PnuC [Flavisolibacter sp.]